MSYGAGIEGFITGGCKKFFERAKQGSLDNADFLNDLDAVAVEMDVIESISSVALTIFSISGLTAVEFTIASAASNRISGMATTTATTAIAILVERFISHSKYTRTFFKL